MTDPQAELRALLTLKLTPGLGDRGIHLLVEALGSAVAAAEAPDRTVSQVVGRAIGGRDRAAAGEAATRTLDEVRGKGIHLVGRELPGYPDRLLHLFDPPPVLFLLGRPGLLAEPSVAVVGSRRATVYGRRVAERIGVALARAGRVVTSGLALGVDAAAHRGTVKAGGDALGVLGAGVDVASPRANRDLHGILAREHLLVSEFLPGTPPLPHHFPRRNRIMAALSSAVVVVEAAERSGALITVNHALDLGVEVLAVPGPVDRPTSAGTNAMIRDGAAMVGDPDRVAELLDALEPGTGPRRRSGGTTDGETAEGPAPAKQIRGGPSIPPRELGPTPTQEPPASPVGLTPDQERVWRALGTDSRGVDGLVRDLGLPAARVLRLLSELEMAGWAEAKPGMRYGRGWNPGISTP